MAKPSLALIVAGSGETNEDEVYDLLEDQYPVKSYDEVGLVFAADKDLFTSAVEHVLAWHGDEESFYPVRTEGAAMTRKTSKFDSQEVAKFTDIFAPSEWEEWDEVLFLVAMPEDPEDPEYDRYAGYVEAAIDNGITVKNLSRGLDDVTLADDDEPEPEPEPEPEEKPKRKRRKKAEPEQVAEEAPEEEPPGDSAEEQAEVARAQVAAAAPETDLEISKDELVYEALGDVVEGLLRLRDLFAPKFSEQDSEKVEEATQESKEKPSRGRGRPRTNFEVRQIWDEDDEKWIARPKGRLKKGTQWRTIHAETDEVLDEGTG